MEKKKLWADIKRSKEGYLWIAPAFIIVSLATVFPLVFAFDYSLYESNIFQKVKICRIWTICKTDARYKILDQYF